MKQLIKDTFEKHKINFGRKKAPNINVDVDYVDDSYTNVEEAILDLLKQTALNQSSINYQNIIDYKIEAEKKAKDKNISEWGCAFLFVLLIIFITIVIISAIAN